MPSLYILSAILIWSSLGVMVRIAEVEVHVLIFYSTIFSLILQGLMFLSSRYRKSIPPPRNMPFVLLISICLLLNTFTFLFAYSKTSIANAVLTHYIAPVIAAVLAALFLGERITPVIVISIVLSTVGLWVMLGGATITECIKGVFNKGIYITSDLLGIASGLLSGFFYALLIVLVRFFTQRFNPYVLVFLQNLFMALLLLPFINYVPFEKLWLFIIMGAVHSTIAPFLYYKGLSSVLANRAAILGYIEPVGAIIFSMIFLNEYPHLRAYFGGGLIVLSGYLTIKKG
jgi:drug/metabolite transporter (DMT)-like permease